MCQAKIEGMFLCNQKYFGASTINKGCFCCHDNMTGVPVEATTNPDINYDLYKASCIVNSMACRNVDNSLRVCTAADCATENGIVTPTQPVTNTACSGGSYYDTSVSPSTCQPCPVNAFCPTGSNWPTPCPAARPVSRSGSSYETECSP